MKHCLQCLPHLLNQNIRSKLRSKVVKIYANPNLRHSLDFLCLNLINIIIDEFENGYLELCAISFHWHVCTWLWTTLFRFIKQLLLNKRTYLNWSFFSVSRLWNIKQRPNVIKVLLKVILWISCVKFYSGFVELFRIQETLVARGLGHQWHQSFLGENIVHLVFQELYYVLTGKYKLI